MSSDHTSQTARKSASSMILDVRIRYKMPHTTQLFHTIKLLHSSPKPSEIKRPDILDKLLLVSVMQIKDIKHLKPFVGTLQYRPDANDVNYDTKYTYFLHIVFLASCHTFFKLSQRALYVI